MGYVPPANAVHKPVTYKPICCNRMVVKPFQVRSVAVRKLYSRVSKSWPLTARVCVAHCVTEARLQMSPEFSNTLWMGRDWSKGFSVFEPDDHNGIILLFAFKHKKTKLYKSRFSDVAKQSVSIGFDTPKALFHAWVSIVGSLGRQPTEQFEAFDMADPNCTVQLTQWLVEHFKLMDLK